MILWNVLSCLTLRWSKVICFFKVVSDYTILLWNDKNLVLEMFDVCQEYKTTRDRFFYGLSIVVIFYNVCRYYCAPLHLKGSSQALTCNLFD